MRELSRFQDAFAAALAGRGDLSGWLSPGAGAVGLTVYRNTVAKGAIDALAANFPTVERLVSPDWFRGCAQAYLVQSPPDVPMLIEYGATFPDFLEGFGPAAELPYLPSVARIDRLWTETHLAADGATPIAPPSGAARLALHPSTRLSWFPEPAPTIWRLNRPPAPDPDEAGWTIDWRPEGIVLARPRGAVTALTISAAGFALLSACGQGAVPAECANAAEDAEPGVDTAALVAELVALGALVEQ